MYFKLSDYAKNHNITYRTAWNRYKAGKIKNCIIDDTGHICINVNNISKTKTVALYARVSSNEMKDNLDRQLERLENFAINNGYTIN
jgi:predicted site-specific integrase-resolvase